MNYATDKLKRLWSGCQNDDERAARLQAAEAIIKNVEAHAFEVEKREAKHKQEMAGLHKRLLAVQLTCPHWLTTYHPDAAGGSDSWTDCDLCGAEITRDMLRKSAGTEALAAIAEDRENAP